MILCISERRQPRKELAESLSSLCGDVAFRELQCRLCWVSCFAKACGESCQAFCGEEPLALIKMSCIVERRQPCRELAESFFSLWDDIAFPEVQFLQ